MVRKRNRGLKKCNKTKAKHFSVSIWSQFPLPSQGRLAETGGCQQAVERKRHSNSRLAGRVMSLSVKRRSLGVLFLLFVCKHVDKKVSGQGNCRFRVCLSLDEPLRSVSKRQRRIMKLDSWTYPMIWWAGFNSKDCSFSGHARIPWP